MLHLPKELQDTKGGRVMHLLRDFILPFVAFFMVLVVCGFPIISRVGYNTVIVLFLLVLVLIVLFNVACGLWNVVLFGLSCCLLGFVFGDTGKEADEKSQ